MAAWTEAEFNTPLPSEPMIALQRRRLAGHVVFEGMTHSWVQNPDFQVVDNVMEQIQWLQDEGYTITPSELIRHINTSSEVM